MPALADTLTQVAANVAAITAHVEGLEQRLVMLEAASATGRQRRPVRQPGRQPPAAKVADTPALDYHPAVAFARIQALRAEGFSLAHIAAQLEAEGVPTRGGQPWGKGLVGWFLKRYGRGSEAAPPGVG